MKSEHNPIMNSSVFGVEIQPTELNIAREKLPDYFLNPNSDNPLDQNDPFESALSSIVSSPTASYNGGGFSGGDTVMLRELIGRLGSICNSGEISPPICNRSTNTSCYSTPLNSPPKLNLENKRRWNFPVPASHLPIHPSLVNADPGFVERAARFSCFGSGNFGLSESDLVYGSGPMLECGKLRRVGDVKGIQMEINQPENVELGDSREGSSVSELNPGGRNEANSRKRKAAQKAKANEILPSSTPKLKKLDEIQVEESNAKRSKSEEDGNGDAETEQNINGKAIEDDEQKQHKEAPKPSEPLKDYIHVRARRGQATDSHSLAERVRREKISERMKFLQDLVPGCNKVTGKAIVLDEIINYVQSLQRQVEFLSMKLATVNHRVDLNMEPFVPKDAFQSCGSFPQSVYQLETAAQAFPFCFQTQQMQQPLPNAASSAAETPFPLNPLNAAVLRSQSIQLPLMDTFNDSAGTQTYWEDDLQSIVQTGFGQNQTYNFNGGQMKVEL